MKNSARFIIFAAILSLLTLSCEKAKLEATKAEALYKTKAQKILATTSGGLHTIIMCKDGKVVVATNTGGSIYGRIFEIQELPNITCK